MPFFYNKIVYDFTILQKLFPGFRIPNFFGNFPGNRERKITGGHAFVVVVRALADMAAIAKNSLCSRFALVQDAKIHTLLLMLDNLS